ncbi:MAG: hypothetical protein PF482_15275 [Desulfobacteraceae bacterium]|jgi:DNA excision repair protein ERCC-4|nr:hypothetical protein [Desulfobacteraceae bacterium]
MVIIQDTREQLPYVFDRWPVSVQAAGLPVGDYSIQGFSDKVAIERKSLDDLINCLMGGNRIRFEKELSRARSFELFAVIVEASFHQISAKQYHGCMDPHAVLQSIVAFHIRYKVPFIFAGDRCGGEYLTFSLLQKFIYEIEKRFKQCRKMEVTG